MCLAGASGAGAELLKAEPNPDLCVRYVWVPVLPPDGRAAAAAAVERFADPRAVHYWDGERQLAQHLGKALRISAQESVPVEGGSGLAWDVYLAYERSTTDLFRPALWMHQIGVSHAPRLDAAAFRAHVQGLLEA